MSSHTSTLLLLGERPVRVIRTRRRTAAVQVRDSRIFVRCPLSTSNEQILSWLGRKSAWLQRHLDQQQRQLDARPRLDDGSLWRYRGKPLKLQLSCERHWSVSRDEHRLLVAGPDLDVRKLSQQIGNWYRSEAKEHMQAMTRDWADKLGVRPRLKAVRFRRTKSKWGHCSHDGVIQYNWLIMQALDSVIEYLVVHEVCHLLEPHHGPAFWTLVDAQLPARKQVQTWLKEHGGSLVFAD